MNGRVAPRLVIVTDTTRVGPERMVERIARVARACPPASVLVQLRDRQLPVRERLALGRRLRAITAEAGQIFTVNDRADLAWLLEADGMHSAETSISPTEARRLLGEGAFLSRACHDPREARALGANAVILSPVLAPRKGAPALGVEALAVARTVGAADDPPPLLYALGGVDAEGARRCLAEGADGAAVVGAVIDAEDASALLEALEIG